MISKKNVKIHLEVNENQGSFLPKFGTTES